MPILNWREYAALAGGKRTRAYFIKDTSTPLLALRCILALYRGELKIAFPEAYVIDAVEFGYNNGTMVFDTIWDHTHK
jgi:hypothetical protein